MLKLYGIDFSSDSMFFYVQYILIHTMYIKVTSATIAVIVCGRINFNTRFLFNNDDRIQVNQPCSPRRQNNLFNHEQ